LAVTLATREAEVAQDRPSIGGHDHVLGLEVGVHEARVVEVLEGRAKPSDQGPDFFVRTTTCPVNEVLARDPAASQIPAPFGERTVVDQGGYTGVVDGRKHGQLG
jgi:hypothetical protein